MAMKNNIMRTLSMFTMLLLLAASPALAGEKPQASGEKSRHGTLSPPMVIQSLPAVGGAWTAQGAAPLQFGQTEGLTNNPVSGAIQAIVAHPSNANIIWAGSVNGGVWKTTNATSASPTWT